MASIGLKALNKLKNSRIGIGPLKFSTPQALIVIGVVAFIASFLIAAILKWIGLAIAIFGVVLLLWPSDEELK